MNVCIDSAIEAICHEFFDELRVEGARLPNGKPMPELFNFTREGQSSSPSLFLMLKVVLLAVFGFCADDLSRRCFDGHTELSARPDLIRTLVPPHAEEALRSESDCLERLQSMPCFATDSIC